jgi:hypothetical protein
MSMKDSAFHVPSCSDSQQTWQDWFDKLAEVPVHYEVSAETIQMVTGHLPSTDRIMYDWSDTETNLRRDKIYITPDHFLEHVRKQLFAL